MLIDQSRDVSGQNIHRISQLYQPPEFVKEAVADDLFGDQNMPPNQYGHPVRKLFPCHTKAATWMSCAFFFDQKNSIPAKEAEVIEDRLTKFANFFNISHSVEQLKDRQFELSNTGLDKLANDDFALIVSMPNTAPKRYYPLRNALEVKTAAEYLFKHKDRLRFSDKKVMAERILEKAARFGAGLGELHDFLEKQAGYGVCSAEDAAKLVWERITVIDKLPNKNIPLLQELTKTAMAILDKEAASTNPDNLMCLAESVDKIDEGLGLKKYYGAILSRPENVLFAITKRAASKLASEVSQLTSGSVYKVADMERLPLNDIRDVFGDDFAEAITKDGVHVDSTKVGQVITTMPRPDAEMFEQMCDQHGIKPCLKQASAGTAFGPSEDELKVWADAYIKTRDTSK